MVREAFKRIVEVEKEDEASLNPAQYNNSGYYSNSSDDINPNDDYYTIDSDREPAEWKHKY